MPVLFLGHGNPMNAITDNVFTKAWSALGASLPKPRAVLSVSAHWYIPRTCVTAMRAPRTIHDFGGFPPELFHVEYPAPGDPALAQRVTNLLSPLDVCFDEEWGLDHGTWSVLCHVFPEVDVPVVQLSIDRTKPPSFHYETGRRLLPLREEGVLIVGSGNIVHNLRAFDWNNPFKGALDWAERFEGEVRGLLLEGQSEKLAQYEDLGPDAVLSAPTPDHYLPLLYAAAVRKPNDNISFPVEGFDGGSISMLGVQIASS